MYLGYYCGEIYAFKKSLAHQLRKWRNTMRTVLSLLKKMIK